MKKPYNPVLGEFFRCKWKINVGGSEADAYFVSEQVSHHPPISAFYYTCPTAKVYVSGEMRPGSKFLGNSAASLMAGGSTIYLGGYPDEEYTVSFPNVYVRGILFGTMLMELGDSAAVKCEASDLVCEIDFTTKGFFSGTYNGLKAKVKRISSGEVLATLGGKWTETITINKKGSSSSETFLNVQAVTINQKLVAPIEGQEEYESRRYLTLINFILNKQTVDTFDCSPY